MTTLQLRAFGKPTTAPELMEAAPLEPGTGHVLVALEAAPINSSDLLLITGRYGVRPPCPPRWGPQVSVESSSWAPLSIPSASASGSSSFPPWNTAPGLSELLPPSETGQQRERQCPARQARHIR